MKILWFAWKDLKHPLAGGAELVGSEIAKRLVENGHEVVFVVGGFEGATSEEVCEGYKIIRLGNRYTVYWKAYRYYKTHLQGWADLVIDEVNTVPFFCKWYAKEPNILLVHQLCREIWFYEMLFPISLIGYLLEPIYLWLLRDRTVITVSQSTQSDLERFGFAKHAIHIISEGIQLDPIDNLSSQQKFPTPTILAFGSIRSMKRTLHAVNAFELVKKTIPSAELIVAGSSQSKYAKRVRDAIERSAHSASIHMLGSVSKQEKIDLMKQAHVLCVTSVKEGWCLVVTEANSQGTPAVVYPVDELRDSVKDKQTGLVSKEQTSQALAKELIYLFEHQADYALYRSAAHAWSKTMTFDVCFQDFLKIIKEYV